MNKTDIVFGLSTLSGFLTLFVKVYTTILSNNVAVIIGGAAILISFLAYSFYEYFQGTTPPPTPPQ